MSFTFLLLEFLCQMTSFNTSCINATDWSRALLQVFQQKLSTMEFYRKQFEFVIYMIVFAWLNIIIISNNNIANTLNVENVHGQRNKKANFLLICTQLCEKLCVFFTGWTAKYFRQQLLEPQNIFGGNSVDWSFITALRCSWTPPIDKILL